MGDYIKVAGKDDVQPGQSIRVKVENQELALFNVEGKLYAIDDVCPHAGGPLSEGFVDGENVICPWHGWEFNVKSGACRVVGLEQKTYPVKIEGDDVLVSTEPASIEDPESEEVTRQLAPGVLCSNADAEYIKVGDESEIVEGKPKLCEINKRQVAIFNVEGKHYAIDDYCPHEGGPLSDGWTEGDCAVCPWHGWEFNLKTGESPYGYKSDTFDVKVENGEVFVCTTPKTEVPAEPKETEPESSTESSAVGVEAEEAPPEEKATVEKNFVRVAAVSELVEKRGKFVEAGPKKVALFKVEDEIFAVDDICPHMGAPLSDGFVEGKSVMCGWHAWEFSLESGECPFGMCIPTYEVKIEGDEIFVGVDAE